MTDTDRHLAEQLEALTTTGDTPPPIGAAAHAVRLAAAAAALDRIGCAALLIGPGPSLRYLTGLGWAPSERLLALVLPRHGDPFLVAPAFERATVLRSAVLPLPIRTWEEDADPIALIRDALPPRARLAFDPELPFRVADALRPGFVIVNAAPLIDAARARKSPAELAIIRHAMRLTLAVQRAARAALRPGLRASTLRRFIDDAHRRLGAPGGSSFCAVQFGATTAFPHGPAGEQVLGARDLVLVDTGCEIGGYRSDITRTYAFGAPDAGHARVWQIEREAQRAAFAAARPGVACADVDRAARAAIEAAGFGPGFRTPGLPHRTGHGIGLSIHEPPWIVPGDRTQLVPGMCFSIEPMIVVPDRFGIRLEDHVVITEAGAEWFTEPAASIEDPFG